MSETSRRKILGVAAAGVVGTAGAVALSTGPASARTSSGASTSRTPFVAYIDDPASGVVQVMVGDDEVSVVDHDLVARIISAAGGR